VAAKGFFGRQAHLTVSGQMNVEPCCSLGIYTFGPTIRAEPSTTRRHLAEFWMVEPEIAFADLDQLIGFKPNMSAARSAEGAVDGGAVG